MRFFTIAAAAVAGVASANPVVLPRQAGGLAAAMKAAGREYIGTALTLRGDSREEDIIKGDFNSVTPENAMKWSFTEPSRGSFSYGGGDAIANFATENNMEMRCHVLVWHSQLPSWVTSGSWSKEELTDIMRTHIDNVAGRWRGKCTHWDVVNEALNDDGSYRSSVFYDVLGEDFIPMAFEMAAAADPDAKLYYNDYNLAYGGSKAQGAVRIVKLIQDKGIRIDGVGLQGHMLSPPSGTTPSANNLANVLRLFTDLDVDVAYTEIDIRAQVPQTAAQIEQAGEAWGRMGSACMAVSRCVGMTSWGVIDKYSWVPSVFSGQGSALIWDDNYNKKPAYNHFYASISGTNPSDDDDDDDDDDDNDEDDGNSGCAAKWGQCGGGDGYTGPTCCVASTCTFSNQWYSQCL